MNLYQRGSRLLSIDPGLRGCGVAYFYEGVLKHALYVANPVISGRGYFAHAAMASAVHEKFHPADMHIVKVVIEHPTIYPGSAQQKGDPNDLIDVACVGSALGAYYKDCGLETVFPMEWKGQTPKEIMNERCRLALSDDERKRIDECSAHLRHNVMDGIGIGLYKLSRVNRRKFNNE